jgi:hypothetical protein
MHFVYVKLPLGHGKAEDERLEDLHVAIDQLLTDQRLGDLISWGASVTPSERLDQPAVVHHRMDMEVADLALALPALQQALATLLAPEGTEVHFTRDGVALQQRYTRGSWSDVEPSTGTHWHH